MCKLDKFGSELMRSVRDVTIAKWDRKAEEKMPAPELIAFVESLPDKQSGLQAIRFALPQIVDSTLFQLLNFVDAEERIEFKWEDELINELSLSLKHELYDVEGWIARFSEERAGLS